MEPFLYRHYPIPPPGAALCLAERGAGSPCVRLANHSGRHAYFGYGGIVIRVWENEKCLFCGALESEGCDCRIEADCNERQMKNDVLDRDSTVPEPEEE